MRRSRLLAVLFAIAMALHALPRPAAAAWPHDARVNVSLAGPGTDQEMGAVLADGSGGAFFAWTDKRGGAEDVYLQHVTVAGVIAPGWPATGLQVCTTVSRKLEPQLVADGAGGVLVVWTDYRGGPSNGDIFAARVNGDGSRAAGFPAGGLQLVVTGLPDHPDWRPRACTDGAGGALVAWESIYSPTDTDIYGAHVTAAGVLAFAGTLDYTPADCRRVSVAEDGVGGFFAAYQDSSVAGIKVFGIHANGAGVALQGPQTLTTAPYSGSKRSPRLAADGAGGCFAVWLDNSYVSSRNDVVLRRFGPTMAVQPPWYDFGPNTSSGVVSPSVDDPGPPIPDGLGGFWLAWKSSALAGNITLAHVLAGSMAPLLTDLAISPASYTPWVALVSDGAGGVILAGSGMGGPAVMRFTASGALASAWPYDGTIFTFLTSDFCMAAGDGAHGVILGWSDYRNTMFVPSGYTVYAQRVDRFGTLGNAEPTIVSVKDAPKDQGGHVRIVWNASYLDSDPTYGVGSYWIWRQTPAAAAQAAVRAGGRWASGSESADAAGVLPGRVFRPSSAQGYAWEYVASQAANASAQYSYVAPTTLDSTGSGNPRTIFMVEAHAAYGIAFWSSAADSGYSVDNIPPVTPAPFVGQYAAGTSHLHWDRNTEPDLAGYRLYRGTSTAFTPGQSNLLSAQPDTGYADASGTPYVYKLKAIDVHGNQSPAAVVVPAGTAGVDPQALPSELAFATPSPNPVGEATTMRFALPQPSAVRLSVYDPAGRVVAELARGESTAGEHSVTWNLHDARGRRVDAGLYFVRLDVAGRSLVRRLAVVH
jgi:hypothetical protein